MTFFFDTNVCIGYIFRWNPWHEKAQDLFSQEKEIFWSDTVKEECKKVFLELVQEYTIFLINIKDKVVESYKGSFFKNDLQKMVKNIPVTKNRQNQEIIDKNNVISSIFEDEGWYDIKR